jgi:hypothetical protein
MNDQGSELKFEAIGAASAGSDLHQDHTKNELRLENLKKLFGLSKKDLDEMFNGEHFNHQY